VKKSLTARLNGSADGVQSWGEVNSTDTDIPALTSLRFVAAAMVFLYHFPPSEPSWVVATLAGQGHVGVTVFFVLSGFLITVRYSDTLGQPGGVTLSDYFRRRCARIVPLYWAVLGVSLVLATGRLEVSWRTLPEWTLVQGFLSRSVHDLAVPTSWTLTLEECFYATAPLLFLGLRRARRFGVPVLLGWIASLLALGWGVMHIVDPERFQFLGSASEMVQHTFFGRFVDFALGVWGGRLFLSGRVQAAWGRRRGAALAAAGGLGGIALIFLGQAGMALAGGVEGPRWSTAWAFNLLVGAGSLVLILCLTSPASWLSRVLSLGPLVYLGRVSYALYLIQLTPLGKGLLYSLIPRETPAFGLLLYAGMTLVSAFLYELVEEPGRKLVLRVWRRGKSASGSPAASTEHRPRETPAWAFVATVAAVAVVQAGAWAGARAHAWQGLPSLAEAQRAAGPLEDRVVSPSVVARAGSDGPSHRVPIPESWMIGAGDDQRAPPSLLVYLDGRPVPFHRRAEGLPPSPASAYYRRPRTSFVELSVPASAVPSEVTLVLHDPPLAARLLAQRLASRPSLLGAVALAAAGAAGAGWLLHQRRRPRFRTVASLAVLAASVFLLTGAHQQSWALVAVAAEILLLGGLAVLTPARARAAARPATDRRAG
jgi:peptidoglycan/LPS O-acetylase OafA/YrhL